MEEEIFYALALKLTRGIGDVLAKQLISYTGSAKGVFSLPRGRILKIPGIGTKVAEDISKREGIELAKKTIIEIEKESIRVLPYFHQDYPSRLKMINDAPLLLFYKGEPVYNHRKIVGIVGTRNASEYGRRVTERIVEELVTHDALVVSGLAYGIDIASHKASLKYNLPTVGVLAGGLNMIYPAAHQGIAQKMINHGGLFSEHPPGVKPSAHHFPARNRIIAGMCDALIVVEAAKRGGALITAEIAYSYNKEVFAVPGELGNKYSEGCNMLLRSQKALIYSDIKDLEYNLNWDPEKTEDSSIGLINLENYTLDEQKILATLSEFSKGLHLDELSWKTQISVNQVVSLLLNLEFSGLIQSLPGKQYKLVKAI